MTMIMPVATLLKRPVLLSVLIISAGVATITLIYRLWSTHPLNPLAHLQEQPVKIGVLYALSGAPGTSEQPVVDAILLAIAEINRQGGVLGRPVVAVIADTESDDQSLVRQANRLIREEQVVSIFGCRTSACRKIVRPVFEQQNHLLIYTAAHEGFETSPNIIYTGVTPNQSLIPAVQWSVDNLGRRFYLIGSDAIFPHIANEVLKEHIRAIGGEIAGEDYLLMNDLDVGHTIDKLLTVRPDVIMNTLTGSSSIAFLAELRARDKTVRTMHFGLSEEEAFTLGADLLPNDYATLSYFQSIDSDDNQQFVRRFKHRYGDDRVVSDAIEAAYASVYLWAQAVNRAQRADVDAIRANFARQTFAGPQGRITVDPDNLHTWKTVRIGRIQHNGQFEIVWSSLEPVRPIPYLASRPARQWQQLIRELYTGWGDRWINEGS